MLRFLNERLRRRSVQTLEKPAEPRVPDDLLVCAIGDIHGRLDLLRSLEDQVVRFGETRQESRRRIVYLGDYIDRGYESRQVIEHFLEAPPEGFERIFLLGNHEEFFLRFIELPLDGPVWLVNGGRETLMSYGVALPPGKPDAGDIARARANLLTRLPNSHLAFMRELKLYHVEGDYLFVHAGVRPGLALTDQQPDDLLWIRETFLDSEIDHGHIVVHGHTVYDEPEIRPNRIGIDTGAYASGRLTGLILAGEHREYVRT